MKKLIGCIAIFIMVISCKSVNVSETGNFIIKNNSDKIIQFVWLAPVGDFYPAAEEVAVGKGDIYQVKGLKARTYDIAVDFKDEYNSFNSKKDSSLCLKIEEGDTKIWIVDESGQINIE